MKLEDILTDEDFNTIEDIVQQRMACEVFETVEQRQLTYEKFSLEEIQNKLKIIFDNK